MHARRWWRGAPAHISSCPRALYRASPPASNIELHMRTCMMHMRKDFIVGRKGEVRTAQPGTCKTSTIRDPKRPFFPSICSLKRGLTRLLTNPHNTALKSRARDTTNTKHTLRRLRLPPPPRQKKHNPSYHAWGKRYPNPIYIYTYMYTCYIYIYICIYIYIYNIYIYIYIYI